MATWLAGASTGTPSMRTAPDVGRIRPAMILSRVDFPQPERPSSATISLSLSTSDTPSRTRASLAALFDRSGSRPRQRRAARFVGRKPQHRWLAPCEFLSVQTKAPLRQPIESPPEQAVERNDVDGHDANPEHDSRIVSALGCLGDVGAEARRLELGVAPAGNFGDDARVPRSSGRRQCAGHVVWKDPG